MAGHIISGQEGESAKCWFPSASLPVYFGFCLRLQPVRRYYQHPRWASFLHFSFSRNTSQITQQVGLLGDSEAILNLVRLPMKAEHHGCRAGFLASADGQMAITLMSINNTGRGPSWSNQMLDLRQGRRTVRRWFGAQRGC